VAIEQRAARRALVFLVSLVVDLVERRAAGVQAYPPDLQKAAVDLVIRQAEALATELA